MEVFREAQCLWGANPCCPSLGKCRLERSLVAREVHVVDVLKDLLPNRTGQTAYTFRHLGNDMIEAHQINDLRVAPDRVVDGIPLGIDSVAHHVLDRELPADDLLELPTQTVEDPGKDL